VIKTLEGFLEECKNKNNDQIYEVFEFGIDDSTYIHIMSHAEDDVMEPVRSAMNNLGKLHGIQSLVDY
jgi:hypothetical protein